MINLDSEYSNYYDLSDPKYPRGKAVDAETDEGIDGTPYLAKWMNDVLGSKQAVFKKAFGSLDDVSGVPDNIAESDFLNALLKIVSDSFKNRIYQFETEKSEFVIPWENLGRVWNSEKKYIVFVQIAESNKFTCCKTKVTQDGIKVIVSEMENGKEKPIAETAKFGSFLWGEKKWGESLPYKINIIVQEVEDDRTTYEL